LSFDIIWNWLTSFVGGHLNAIDGKIACIDFIPDLDCCQWLS
jgi:hypothetical protein